MHRLDVYFDYGSPYSYLAWYRLQHGLAVRDDVEVVWHPVSAGHIFAKEGTQPNMAFPNQAAYHLRDVQRWADALEVPYVRPSRYPQRTLDAARAHFVAEEEGPTRRDAWMRACFDAHWTRDADLSDRTVLEALARDVGLQDLDEAIARPEVRARLVAETDAAYAAGAPGVPFLVLDDEGFWGNDRLDWVEARLDGTAAPPHLQGPRPRAAST